MGDINGSTQGDWRRYTYQLVPNDSQLEFPAAEGTHRDYQSDTCISLGI